IANLTTEASLPSERFVFEFIMAVLFYALCFITQFVCTLPKAPDLAVALKQKTFSSQKYFAGIHFISIA
ncbi:MAG: hypothetical protein U0M62_07010, partial [Lachnospiraceae bacterium]